MLQSHTGGALLCHSLGRSSFWSQTLELGPSQELAALGLDLIPVTNTLKRMCICRWGVVFVPSSVKRTTLLTQFSPSIFRRVLGIKLRLLSWCQISLPTEPPCQHFIGSILFHQFRSQNPEGDPLVRSPFSIWILYREQRRNFPSCLHSASLHARRTVASYVCKSQLSVLGHIYLKAINTFESLPQLNLRQAWHMEALRHVPSPWGAWRDRHTGLGYQR